MNAPGNTPRKLSVVIACLDAASTLRDQLDGLAGQTWSGDWERDWEVIVADNGSTDGSQALVESYRGRIPGLRVVDASDRKGQAHARNVGSARAAGDALLFVDADDQVAPGWLEAVALALSRHAFVACRYDNQALNPPWVRRTHLNPQKDGVTRYDYPPFLPHAGGGGLAVLRQVHEEVGGFDETMPALEDTDYCWRIQLAGHELAFAPDAVVRIRHRHDLRSLFRQGLSYGRNNVLIYKKYLPLGMPRLGWMPGVLRWGKLLLRTPLLLLTREGRARWVWQLGWRVGRLQGCWRYRVLAP